MIIGVSGKSGSGKSVVSNYLASCLGCKWIDVDRYAKEIREEYKSDIIQLINVDDIVDDKGNIDSKLLGRILFNDKELMEKYNLFIYSKLKVIIKELVDKYENVVIDTIFLPIMDVFYECNYKFLVVCDDELRKERLSLRDDISLDYIEKRDVNGLSYSEAEFDFVIDNSKDYKLIIDEIITKIKS